MVGSEGIDEVRKNELREGRIEERKKIEERRLTDRFRKINQ